MRATWLAIAVLAAGAVAGCGGKGDADSDSGSGAATRIAPPKPAPLPAVAAVVAPAPTGALVAELADPIPEGGFTFATEIGSSLVLVKLDRTGFHSRTVLPAGTVTHVAWANATTLIEMSQPIENDKPVVTTIVNGAVTGAVGIDEVWAGGRLAATATGEVWVDRCARELDSGACARTEYNRVYPAPQKVQGSVPQGLDRTTADLLDGTTAAGVTPAVAPPDGYTIEKAKLPANDADDKPKLVTIARCRYRGGFPADYPLLPLDTDDLAAMRFAVKDVHWVVTDPPIYEVSAVRDDGTNTGKLEAETTYWLACNNRPLDGFIGLGGGLWGMQTAGTWVFRTGTTEVGRLSAGALHRAPAPAAR